MGRASLQKVSCPAKRLDDYFTLAPETVAKIKVLVAPLQGLRLTHINATSVGGGVAEMLRSEVALQQDTGLDSSWYVIPPDEPFFEVTKMIHNFLQGKEGDLTDRQKKIYLDYNNKLAAFLSGLKTDVLIIHDPQPAAALSFLNGLRPQFSIWRCHIDTSCPNRAVWDFLLPYLKSYNRYVFTMPEYANNAFDGDKVSFITPVIDPLSPKNLAMSKPEAKAYLKKLGIDITEPLITQVSRLDPWKDPQGVVDAYRLAKKQIPGLQLSLVANLATDDPEGVVILEQVRRHISGERGIYLFVNLEDNDRAVNAFQVGSEVILQKSIREGFGLTVTEAMWKGAVVVGGNAAGIKLQIQDGVNGFLVSSVEQAARRIVRLLNDPVLMQRISKAAHLSVKQRFLLPHKLLNYLELLNNHFYSRQENSLFPNLFQSNQTAHNS